MGGFFWIMQCVVVFGTLFELIGWPTQLGTIQEVIKNLPESAITLLTALLGAAGLIALLATGVFLDLLGSSLFRPLEMRVFGNHARKNAGWMQRFVGRYEDYIQNDWRVVLASPRFMHIFIPRHLKFWTGYKTFVETALESSKTYRRMHSFLLSWISLVAGSDKIEMLNSQVSFWIISRACATTLYFAGAEAIVAFSIWVQSLEIKNGIEPGIGVATFTFAIQIILVLASLGVSTASYSRGCGTIFALCYIADTKSDAATTTTPSFVQPGAVSLGEEDASAG